MRSPALYNSIFQSLPYPSLLFEAESPFSIVSANRSMLDLAGHDMTHLSERPLAEWIRKLSISSERLPIEEFCKQVTNTGTTVQIDALPVSSYSEQHRQTVRYWKPMISPVDGVDESGSYLLLTFVDYTKQRLEEEERLSRSYKLAKIGTWEYDLETEHLHWSNLTKDVHGFGPDYEPDVESTIQLFKEGYHRDTFANAANDAIHHHKPFDLELKLISGQGDERWVRATCQPEYKDGVCVRFYGISQNVTEKKEQEEKLRESVKEKEILLAEIHHRVKNNLAVVSGLLQLQSLKETDPGVQRRLKDSITRIQTMSNIHEQLYQSESFSRLDFSENIELLINNILSSYRQETDVSVQFELDYIHLNIYQAIPASLIVNEIVTNILKHAFNGREEGLITVELRQSDETSQIDLTISDNGVGLPENFTPRGQSLGLKLIDVLSQQLEGTCRYDSSGQGTRFTIRFTKTDTI